ncbi:MAG: hypothetical protein HY328_13165 [Chloroflexi bacterium]|nr:hypothetical protein [Chloroflexota bacterium]
MLFVALMGAVNGSRPAQVRGPFVIPPTATPQVVAAASLAPTATEVSAPTPIAAEAAGETASAATTDVTVAAPAGDAAANRAGVVAGAPVTTTGTVSSTASAPDLPPVVDLPPISSVADPRVALGETVFQKTAGGVGCQLCHGPDARGLVGPNIVGKTEDAIRAQFETNAQMQFIILSDKEMSAVATYLQFLADPSTFALLSGGGAAGSAGTGTGAETVDPVLSDPAIARGEEIFQKTAGGVGCQLCHGKDATGLIGPNIIGKTADDIRYQFEHNSRMQFIILNNQEVEAVAGYLQYLANPTGGVAASAAAPTVMDPVVAQGEQIYNVTAGGVGCGLCHGANAAGGLAPAIVGATVEDIRAQFARSTQEQFITLTDQEFDAVATYLQYLANPTAGTAASTETGTGNGPSLADPQVATGERVFQFTAGGVGCQLCHGKDATGLIGPNIVGKTADDIRTQFEVNAQMQFIILTDAEIDAVATYLQYLATQP